MGSVDVPSELSAKTSNQRNIVASSESTPTLKLEKTMNTPALHRLLWKDAITVKPLLIAIVIGIIVFNLIVLLFARPEYLESSYATTFLIWILMPNLMALGVPAMLVGTEQESGTFDWMRTLPISWKKVVASKILIGVAATLLVWAIASFVLWVTTSTYGHVQNAFASDLKSADGVLYLLYFSISLLFCGYVTAFLLRSPVAALLSVVPLVTCLTWVLNETARWYLGNGPWGSTYSAHGAATSEWLTVVVAAIFVIVALASIAIVFARRRLTMPSRNISLSLPRASIDTVYRPPRNLVMKRPSPVMAMLWQQRQQIAIYAAALIAINLYFGFIHGHSRSYESRQTVLAEFAPLVMMLSVGWLGCLAFYGDSVRRRCAYFADRGVSPTKVWWTRLLPVCLIGIVLLGIWFWASWMRNENNLVPVAFTVYMLVIFACGQMAAMWLRRPTLSFFAAPVYTLLISLPYLFFLLPAYESYLWTPALALPVLFFATWRLTGRWLERRIDIAFHWRAIAYSILAAVLPCIVIVGHRLSTMPAAMPEWRAQNDVESRIVGDLRKQFEQHRLFRGVEISPQAHDAPYFVDDEWEVDSLAKISESMESEVGELRGNGPRRIGAFVSASKVNSLLTHTEPADMESQFDVLDESNAEKLDLIYEKRLLAIEVLLRWARLVREEAAEGRVSLSQLVYVAESAEQSAAIHLRNRIIREMRDWDATESTDHAEILRLVELVPDAELRKSSRINSLAQGVVSIPRVDRATTGRRYKRRHGRFCWPFDVHECFSLAVRTHEIAAIR